ncbi:MAG: serine/threonine-protein phosphatase [Desulfobulbaceae bacterium]|nr:serine/threonine-protein phosphatase [Desulfobulbaceae bacterium]
MFGFIKNLFRPRHLKLTCAGQSDTGMVRATNEDAFAAFADRRLFLVADGMGGHNAGEIASLATVKVIGDHLSPAILENIHGNKREARHTLIKSFNLANEMVIALAADKEEWHGMGCTLVLAYVDEATLHVCHVGDARCYVVSGGIISQITNDHTNLREMHGDISDDCTINERVQNRHVVTRVIGYPFPEPPEYTSCPFHAGDRILLCSDGLWSMLDEQTLLRVLTDSDNPNLAVASLIHQANTAGGPDNITGLAIYS